MAPRTRRQNTITQMGSAVPSTDTPAPPMSKKKGKKKRNKPTLPRLTVRVPPGAAAAVVTAGSVTLGKHHLSPEDDLGHPTADVEQGHAAPEHKRTKSQHVKKFGSTNAYPPLYELTDEEDVSMPSRTSNIPPSRVRKLKRTETLLDVKSVGSDSLTETDTEGSDSSNDEECADLTKLTQTARSSKRSSEKMALERPSWPASATDDMMDKSQGDIESYSTPDSVPGPLSLASDHSPPSSYSQAHAYTHSDLETTGSTSKGNRTTHSHSEDTQRTSLGFTVTASNGHHTTSAHSNQHQVFEPRLTVQPQEWPAETNLCCAGSGKMKLMDQSQLIHDIITASFPFLRASIVTCHAFPDAILISTFVLRALLAATSHNPGATHVRHRVLNDHMYLAKMVILPRARISVFRAEVKDRCTAAVALIVNVHDSPTLIADLIERQTSDYNYIFPRRGSSNILSGPANPSRPYRSTVITSVIRDLFFTGPVPFVTRHQDLFRSHQGANGNVSYEVPKAMVALVSTAYYAALKEWSTGERKQCDFTANMNLDVYKGHVDSLDRIENTRKPFYLRMMAEIYELAASNFGQTTVPVPTLDMNMLEFED